MSAIFHLTCPSCGARVPVHSPTSVLVVCEYCQSTLLRDGEGVRDSGRKSTILEDYSPLQIHTSGIWQGLAFQIIGRIQMRYDRGFWNEWYVMFANGSYGWLADSGWQYVLTKLSMPLPTKLDFFELVPGASRLNYQKQIYIAADVRTAQYVSANAQGELPFVIKTDWESRAADFRSGKRFLTLDYSDDHQEPIVYSGHSVTLKDLHCQLLRSREQIIETAGKLRGEVTPFSCPNCGSALNWYPGVAQNILCPSCHSDINMGAGKAELISTHRMRVNQRNAASINLGERAKIGGLEWAVIGMIRMQELDDRGDVYNQNAPTSQVSSSLFNTVGKTLISANKTHVYGYGMEAVQDDNDFQPIYEDNLFQSSEWNEYLLYNPEHGFRWIVESEEGWDLTRLIDEWPAMDSNGNPVLLNKSFKKGYDYGSKVLYAAGAFYWHVLPGDVTYISDYVHKNETLSAERNRFELSWSRARRITGDEVATWFKRPELAKKRSKIAGESNLWTFRRTATVFTILLIVCNLPFLISQGLDSVIESLFWGLAFIWVPIFWTNNV